MSYFIIIRGPAGVGKTSIAHKLSQLLHAYYIGFDTVLQCHNLDFISENGCVSECNMLLANKMIIPEAQERLKNRQSVIFDGNFYHKSQLEDLITELKYPYLIFTLKADLPTCSARNKMRKQPLNDQEIKNVFELVSKFDYGEVINTNGYNVGEIVQKILKEIYT